MKSVGARKSRGHLSNRTAKVYPTDGTMVVHTLTMGNGITNPKSSLPGPPGLGSWSVEPSAEVQRESLNPWADSPKKRISPEMNQAGEKG